ncbi:hypothetical protein JXE04_02200 [Patescibacteria group bacterium]|nr:hypothetical protein [Patescibacteria group bacterium]
MKKILSLTLLLAMSLAVFTFLPARAEDDISVDEQAIPAVMSVRTDNSNILEKIPSPDQLKYFKVMKRENGTLYGVRIQANVAANETKNENSNTSLGDKVSNLEKILAPQFIGLYEKIQKIGTSLWGVKKGGVASNTKDAVVKVKEETVKNQRLVTADMVECVSNAINTKDIAMIALTNDSAEKIAATINARGACQKTSLASVDNQVQNLKDCVVIFQKAHQEIVTESRQKQKDIWADYQVEMKACAASSSVIDVNAELVIDDGGNNVLDSVLD